MIEEYLKRTQTATKLMFDGVREYRARLKEALGPTFVTSYVDDDDLARQHAAWIDRNAADIAKARELWEKYFEETLAQATLAGSVLQIAHAAVERFSTNRELATDFAGLVGGRARRFCIGRRVRGVPLGLVVLAGRNQHMHFADGEVQTNTRLIFDRLALGHGFVDSADTKDPAFDVDNPSIESFAHNIIGAIGWKSYADFERDMLRLFNGSDHTG